MLAGATMAGCATARPTETISLVTASGRVVSVDSLTMSYDVAGVSVIQRPSSANDIVAADLYLIGGVQEITPTTAGIETLILRASEYGTDRYPDTAARFALAATGSRIVVDPEDDWTMFGFRGVVAQFDSTWAVLADRITHPTLATASIELVRSQMLREARERGDSPDGAVTLLADSLAFSGHPYGLHPSGTERSLAALTPDGVRRFVSSHFLTSRMLLVIVGNVSRSQVEHDVESTLGRLPHGQYSWHPPPAVPGHATSLTVVPRSLSTNYLLGYFHGPAVTQGDYPAFEIATLILSNRLNQAIRTARSLSYVADAPYIGDALATGGVYVSTDVPDEVVPLIHDQIETCRRTWVPQSTIDRFIEWYITQYLMRNETNEAQAGSLARAQIYLHDYRRASRTMIQLRQVTPADLIRVSQRYMHDIQFAYVGDPARIKGVRVSGM